MFVPGTTILGNPHQGNSFFFGGVGIFLWPMAMVMVREAGTLAKDGGELARVSCEVGGLYGRSGGRRASVWDLKAIFQKIQWVNGKIHGIFFWCVEKILILLSIIFLYLGTACQSLLKRDLHPCKVTCIPPNSLTESHIADEVWPVCEEPTWKSSQIQSPWNFKSWKDEKTNLNSEPGVYI